MPSNINFSFPTYHVVNFSASYNTALGVRVPLNITQRAVFHRPNPLDDKSGIIVLRVNVDSKDTDQLHLSIVVEMGVVFSRKPDDYNEFITKNCLPIVQQRVVESIKTLTQDMGFSPLDIGLYGLHT